MDWKTIQEILKDGWGAISGAPVPVLGLMVVVSAIVWWSRGWIHRGKVDALEERLNLAKDQEASAVVVAAAQSQATPAEQGLESRPVGRTDQQLDPLERPNVSQLVLAQEARIRADLARLHLDEQPEKAINLLIEHLATAQLLHTAEQLYRQIFGSQIAILKHLNLTTAANEERIREFYNDAAAQFPTLYEHYSFSSYLNFLRARGLIATQDDASYTITSIGRAFLQWMVANGISEAKPF
jgi:hypothetical protein